MNASSSRLNAYFCLIIGHNPTLNRFKWVTGEVE